MCQSFHPPLQPRHLFILGQRFRSTRVVSSPCQGVKNLIEVRTLFVRSLDSTPGLSRTRGILSIDFVGSTTRREWVSTEKSSKVRSDLILPGLPEEKTSTVVKSLGRDLSLDPTLPSRTVKTDVIGSLQWRYWFPRVTVSLHSMWFWVVRSVSKSFFLQFHPSSSRSTLSSSDVHPWSSLSTVPSVGPRSRVRPLSDSVTRDHLFRLETRTKGKDKMWESTYRHHTNLDLHKV